MKNANNYTKIARKVGRPSKYRPIFAEKLTKYAEKEPYSEGDWKITGRLGVFPIGINKVANELPTIDGFACQNNITATTCVNWANAKTSSGEPKYPEFFAAYRKLKSVQKVFLITNGLLGLYSGRFAIFVSRNLLRDEIKLGML